MLQRVSDHKGFIIRELYTVFGKNYSNGSFVSVDMDVVGVMATYLPVVRVCTAQSRVALFNKQRLFTLKDTVMYYSKI